ncbi:MAG: Tol-Pal system beta propeller repeat protein TolB [Gammaproteobacteria bacterium]
MSLRIAGSGLAILLALITSSPAMAQLRIEINRGVSEAVPVAVVPFAYDGTGNSPIDVAGIIAGDLERSGRFAPLPAQDMISKPTTAQAVNFTDWRLLKTDFLVIGTLLDQGGDRYMIRFQVFDVFRGSQVLGFQIPASAEMLRAASHRASDMIFEKLTGTPGAFSTRIAYISVTRAGDRDLYRLFVADADGANPQMIAESSEPLMSPSWSPDGRRLAYVSFEGKRSGIYVQELTTGKRTQVSARPGINGAPAFSPDGRWLALTLSGQDGNLDIHVLNPATGALRRLTTNSAIDTEAAWSADGKEIYFTSDRSGGPQVYAVPADGSSNPRRVTFEGRYNARPRVTPDGNSLVVVHNDQGNYRIALVDLQTKATRILTDGRQDESPSLAPNGTMIIYATRVAGRGTLAAVSTDGRISQSLAAAAGDVREPAWSPYPKY